MDIRRKGNGGPHWARSRHSLRHAPMIAVRDLTAVGRTYFNVRTLTILTFKILQVYVVTMNNGYPATGENQCNEDNVNGPNTPRY